MYTRHSSKANSHIARLCRMAARECLRANNSGLYAVHPAHVAQSSRVYRFLAHHPHLMRRPAPYDVARWRLGL